MMMEMLKIELYLNFSNNQLPRPTTSGVIDDTQITHLAIITKNRFLTDTRAHSPKWVCWNDGPLVDH